MESSLEQARNLSSKFFLQELVMILRETHEKLRFKCGPHEKDSLLCMLVVHGFSVADVMA